VISLRPADSDADLEAWRRVRMAVLDRPIELSLEDSLRSVGIRVRGRLR
jgi:hypothetical protein